MKLDQGKVLLYSAIAVGAPRWAGAMLSADVDVIGAGLSDFLHVMNVISGLAMGPLEVLAMAFMLDSLRKQKPFIINRAGRKPNFRWWGVLAFSIGLLALTPAILSFYIVSRINGYGMASALPTHAAQMLWSVAVTLAPVFIVGGVAFAQNGLVSAAQNTTNATQETQAKKVIEYPRSCLVDGCDYVASDRFAYSAHMKKHKIQTPSVTSTPSNGGDADEGSQ